MNDLELEGLSSLEVMTKMYEDQVETSTILGGLVAEMVRALEAAEWGGSCMSYYKEHCPVCDEDKRMGHATDCVLAAALAKARER